MKTTIYSALHACVGGLDALRGGYDLYCVMPTPVSMRAGSVGPPVSWPLPYMHMQCALV
jgi:hypothetical protein